MSTGRPVDDRPWLVVKPEELVAVDSSPQRMQAIPGSRMFEIKNALDVFRRDHPDAAMFDASQGDGGASLAGVPGELLERAAALQRAHGSGYDQPFGTKEFREAVAGPYWQLDAASGWGPANVIACQGGRDALLKAYEAALFLGHGRRGDFVLVSRVPWVSYSWGPYAVGANVLIAPGDEADGWALEPEVVTACASAAEAYGGRKVAMVVVTSPDNPTGRSLTLDHQVALGKAAIAAGIPFVLYDWIYHRVTDGACHDLNAFLAAFSAPERDRLIILDGITKSLGASNIRNAHLVAAKPVVAFIQSRASHGVIPSYYSMAVAVAAYQMGFDQAAEPIVGPTNRSRAVLADFLARHEIRHVIGKGYYAFIDVGPWLDRAGLADSAALGAILGERCGIAVVPGVYFSDAGARWIRFSYALKPETTAAAAERLWEGLSSL